MIFTRLIALIVLMLLPLAAGCEVAGAVASKVTGPASIPPRYAVPADQPMLVLVESYSGALEGSFANDEIAAYVIRELKAKQIAPLIDQEELFKLRDRKGADFAKMRITEIGAALNARQVLYVNVKDLQVIAADGIDMYKGTMSSMVKVIDVPTSQSRFPTGSAEGEPVSVETRIDLDMTESGAYRALYRLSADRIVRLFYKYKPDEVPVE